MFRRYHFPWEIFFARRQRNETRCETRNDQQEISNVMKINRSSRTIMRTVTGFSFYSCSIGINIFIDQNILYECTRAQLTDGPVHSRTIWSYKTFHRATASATDASLPLNLPASRMRAKYLPRLFCRRLGAMPNVLYYVRGAVSYLSPICSSYEGVNISALLPVFYPPYGMYTKFHSLKTYEYMPETYFKSKRIESYDIIWYQFGVVSSCHVVDYGIPKFKNPQSTGISVLREWNLMYAQRSHSVIRSCFMPNGVDTWGKCLPFRTLEHCVTRTSHTLQY